MRPRARSAVASLLYLAAGLAWLALAREPWWVGVWFVLVAVAGASVPGEANQVSLARAYLAAPAAAYAVGRQFAPLAVVVAIAGLTDLVDGTVARRIKQPTNFGGGLDPVVDGLFMGGLAVGLALGGAYPLWLAGVVIARYLLPALAGAALLGAGRNVELRHTLTGQVSTTLILVLLGGIALFRGLDQDPGNLVTGAEIVIPIATLATFVHLGFALRRRRAGSPGPA